MGVFDLISTPFRGRLSRKAYVLYWFLPTASALGLLEFGPEELRAANAALFDALAYVAMVVDAPLGFRRFHDGGMSGWWFAAPRLAMLPWLLSDVPHANETVLFRVLGGIIVLWWFWSFYRLLIRAGESGPNKFGPDSLIPARANSGAT